MEKQVLKRIIQALEEEEICEPDLELLNHLRELASQETDYFSMSAERRNALNEWFDEVKECLLQEVMIGNFGVQILLDTFFILCFEVGYRLGTLETLKRETKKGS